MSITAANAVVTLSIGTLFPIPQTLSQFSMDDIFSSEPIDTAEIQMGADGYMTAGIIYVPVKLDISLLADSASNTLFENWYMAEQALKDKIYASGLITLISTGKKYSMVKGVLTSYPTMPNAKKVLQPRKYGITWQAISPAVAL